MGSIEPRIKIANWNARSLRAKKYELSNFLAHECIDIGMITETRLNPSCNFSLPNHSIIRLDRPNPGSGGGVAILVRRGIRYNIIPHPKTKIIEAIGVKISTLRGDITFFVVYVPQQCMDINGTSGLFTEDLKKLTEHRTRFVVAGDLNARHALWRNRQGNKNGKLLADFLDSGTCTIHFPDKPTYLSTHGTTSTLDVFLSDLPLSKPVTHHQLDSDHYPVVCVLECSPTLVPTVKRPDYHRVQWTTFNQLLESRIPDHPELQTIEAIDYHLEKFEDAVHFAENTCVQWVPVKHTFVQIDPDTRRLIQQRNAVRRRYQRTGCPLQKFRVSNLNSLIKVRMTEIRNRNFANNIERMEHLSRPFWKTAKILKQKPKALPPLKDDSEELLVSPIEKANAIASKLIEAHSLGNTMVSPHETAVRQTSMELSERNDDMTFDEITEDDVCNAVKKAKNMKAPGNDAIFNLVLKKLSSKSYRYLAAIFNSCFRLNHFPTRWKTGKVIPILKPGKDPTLPKSYRPITLLSAVSKILERLILQRLMVHVEQQQVIMPQQFGFRKGHSTVHQLVRVENIIKRTKSLSDNCAMILLDVEKAFDNVWHSGLIHKLVQKNFPTYLVKIVSSYLSNRNFEVHIAGARSESHRVPAGVPQGSVLGPLLYNIYTSDVPQLPAGCKLALYADDCAILANGRTPIKYRSKLQKGVTEYVSYLNSWKIKVNGEKCQAIVFKHRPAPKLSPPPGCNIIVNGIPISWTNEVNYLGVIIDEKLLYRSHTEKIKSRCFGLLQTLYPLINRRSKLHLRNKLAVYKAIIAPMVNYAMPMWGSCAEVHKRKLQITENKILRMILDAPRDTRISELHNIAGCKMIRERIEDAFAGFIVSAEMSDNQLIRELIG